ncbi:hypothetical protein ABCW44_09345 [Mannheimia haemolytica]|uniref:hypothetical protein n=1 Tax=Mannheimia haemolytica TaxID=75985 RepID=UPI001ADB29D2|nr:hypothetical protein [Mannheimia haemolytica]MEE3701282.1 hypothetical protein [Mannheimia haemolytica]
MQQAQATTKKIVSFQEAFDTFRKLGWRMEHLQECGATGADFLSGIEEELNEAKGLLNRKFNAKAKANGLDEKLASRVARIENHIFNTAGKSDTVH